MEPHDSSLRNASVFLAGGTSLVLVLARIISPYYDLLPIRGSWMIKLLVTPVLCLWCGMLLHYSLRGKARTWGTVVASLLAAVMLYFTRLTVDSAGMDGAAAYFLFSFFLGLALPWDPIRKNGDHMGAKSAVLCILTALAYTALQLVWQRLIIGSVMVPECEDMRQFLLVVVTNVLPLAMIPPILLVVELAFSKAGQWLGSRKWFLWLAIPTAIISFFGALARSPYRIALDLSWETAVLIRILVQPVSVYLLVVLVRIVKGVANSGLEWKNVFTI
jgi:hypothetical protein